MTAEKNIGKYENFPTTTEVFSGQVHLMWQIFTEEMHKETQKSFKYYLDIILLFHSIS